MSDVLHNHVTRDMKPRGECPACDQIKDVFGTTSSIPPAVDEIDVRDWGPLVADQTTIISRRNCCLICADENNHGGGYCPTGITRDQADWVRERRKVGLGPAAVS